ncbi:MAG: hypothetical protein DWQ07_14025 [Chloroflexi bacterium]|nr:MAG: hypothetical protein DWQ07_14025 [Chloroflexota bacterium]
MTIPTTIQIDKTQYQLPGLSRNQLEVLKTRCQTDIAGMRAQLNKADRRKINEGRKPNYDWYNRCSWALKRRGEALTAIQHYLDQAPSPDPNDLSLADHFMEEAEFVLDTELWQQIYARAIAAHEEVTGLRSEVVMEAGDV